MIEKHKRTSRRVDFLVILLSVPGHHWLTGTTDSALRPASAHKSRELLLSSALQPLNDTTKPRKICFLNPPFSIPRMKNRVFLLVLGKV